MPHFLIKLNDGKKDYYLEWSTIVDAPITWGLSLEELKKYIKKAYGEEGLKELDARLKRIEKHGHSGYSNVSVKDLIKYNRAGEKEGKMSIKGIIKKYCHERPK